jgi:hypothetical protein
MNIYQEMLIDITSEFWKSNIPHKVTEHVLCFAETESIKAFFFFFFTESTVTGIVYLDMLE